MTEADRLQQTVDRVRALADEYERNAQLIKVSIGDDLITRWQAFEDAAASIRRALERD